MWPHDPPDDIEFEDDETEDDAYRRLEEERQRWEDYEADSILEQQELEDFAQDDDWQDYEED